MDVGICPIHVAERLREPVLDRLEKKDLVPAGLKAAKPQRQPELEGHVEPGRARWSVVEFYSGEVME